MSSDAPSTDGPGELTEAEFEERVRALREFDLGPVTERLRYKHGYDDADELEMKFRRFAKLVLERPEADLAPANDLDEYWHAFILDTPRYHRFCEQVFGSYLHHVPGEPGERDADAYVQRVESDEVDAYCEPRVEGEE